MLYIFFLFFELLEIKLKLYCILYTIIQDGVLSLQVKTDSTV